MDRKTVRVIQISQKLCLIGGILLILSGLLFLASYFSMLNLIPLSYFSDNWGVFTFFCFSSGIMVVISATMMSGHRKTGQYVCLVLGIGCVIGLLFYPQIDYFNLGLNIFTFIAIPIASILILSGGLISTLSRFTLEVDFITQDKNVMVFLLIIFIPIFTLLLPLYHINSFYPIRGYNVDSCCRDFEYSSNGNYIAALTNGNISVLQKTSSTPLWSFNFPQAIDIDISSDGKYILASSDLMGVALFDILSPTPLWINNSQSSTSVDISYLGDVIAVSDDKSVLLFDKISPSPINNYSVTNEVDFFGVSTLNIAIVSYKHLFFYNIFSTTPLWNFTNGQTIRAMSMSSEGNYIALGYPYTLCLFDITNSTPLWNYTLSNTITSVIISSDGSHILVRDKNTIFLFNKYNSVPIWTISLGGSYMDISYNGSYFIATDQEFGINYFSNSSSTPLWSYCSANQIGHVAISSDGSSIIASSRGKLFLFSGENFYVPETLLRLFGLSTIVLIPSLVYAVWKIRSKDMKK